MENIIILIGILIILFLFLNQNTVTNYIDDYKPAQEEIQEPTYVDKTQSIRDFLIHKLVVELKD